MAPVRRSERVGQSLSSEMQSLSSEMRTGEDARGDGRPNVIGYVMMNTVETLPGTVVCAAQWVRTARERLAGQPDVDMTPVGEQAVRADLNVP